MTIEVFVLYSIGSKCIFFSGFLSCLQYESSNPNVKIIVTPNSCSTVSRRRASNIGLNLAYFFMSNILLITKLCLISSSPNACERHRSYVTLSNLISRDDLKLAFLPNFIFLLNIKTICERFLNISFSLLINLLLKPNDSNLSCFITWWILSLSYIVIVVVVVVVVYTAT
ncbi:hypothetical protein BpHYR1_004833 [Brachionus plicatilis]|uniref:Uncharacterized protein n=1 Tax=Brachionus plicatilis TaxID=10195 RepID=A0A3M7QLE4_BRAPC|nr:hypothetical protein BpHYR1_004833 [Brachionus plicatilis]